MGADGRYLRLSAFAYSEPEDFAALGNFLDNNQLPYSPHCTIAKQSRFRGGGSKPVWRRNLWEDLENLDFGQQTVREVELLKIRDGYTKAGRQHEAAQRARNHDRIPPQLAVQCTRERDEKLIALARHPHRPAKRRVKTTK